MWHYLKAEGLTIKSAQSLLQLSVSIKFLFQKKYSALLFQGINTTMIRTEEEVTNIQPQLLGINHKGSTTTLLEALRIFFFFSFLTFPVPSAYLLSSKRAIQVGFKKCALSYKHTHASTWNVSVYSSTFFNINADIFSLFWI